MNKYWIYLKFFWSKIFIEDFGQYYMQQVKIFLKKGYIVLINVVIKKISYFEKENYKDYQKFLIVFF